MSKHVKVTPQVAVVTCKAMAYGIARLMDHRPQN
jgi:hypothetical protein